MQAAYDHAIDSRSNFYTLPTAPECRFQRVYISAALWMYRRLGCRLHRVFAGRRTRKEYFRTWDGRKNDITFVPTVETHGFAFSGSDDVEWKIHDVHDADSIMRTNKMEGCAVSLNDHVWSNLPSPDAFQAGQDKLKGEGFKRVMTPS